MSTASAGYRAAVEGVAVFARTDRCLLRVSGRAPRQMLDGILTSTLPSPERRVEPGVRAGRAYYSTLLTPKGRMVSDLRVLCPELSEEGDEAPSGDPVAGAVPGGMTRGPATPPGREGAGGELLLDLPAAGREGVLAHFTRFLPPRFAAVEDVSGGFAILTVLGPGSPRLLSLHALGLRVESDALDGLGEGEYRAVETGADSFARVIRTADVSVPAFDVLADPPTVRGLCRALVDAGAEALDADDMETLRIEAGRPAFGVDMDDDTIPVEAGLGERAIDHGKGCYTGQEVIIRIRDRGHVNRVFRGLRLGGEELPAPGTTLYAPDVRGERSAGELTSVADSPRMGPVALGYVRREVEPGDMVRVGRLEGSEAVVVDLEGGGWGPER